jgi:DNA-binding response OmpR family regulator
MSAERPATHQTQPFRAMSDPAIDLSRAASATPPDAPAVRPRIVVAEDHAEMADVLLTYLEAAGYEVHLARDGVLAESLIETVQPALAVLDANMPGLSGWTLLSRIKAGGAKAPLVVMLTGDDDFPAEAASADVILRKPAALRRVAAVLADLLQHRASA